MAPVRRTVDYRIDPFDLHLFAAVVQHGTMTAAATAVNLSLAAASARLKALEDATGARLLQRSKTGSTPTDAGRALARHAHRVLAELESLHVDMASFGHGLRGTLRLLCNTAAMSEALPSRLGSFLLATPDLDVDVQELPSEDVIDALRRGTADLGIVADHVDASGLLVKPWIEDRLVALLPGRTRSRADAMSPMANCWMNPWSACRETAASAASWPARPAAADAFLVIESGWAASTRWPVWWRRAPVLQ